MSSIMRGDKVILVKEHDKMKMVGATLEVGNITETSVVLRNPKSKVAIAAIGIDEFDKYFKHEVSGWTAWTELTLINGLEGNNIGWYRTNHRKVQVKLNNGVCAEATCNKTDQFNLYLGVNIAIHRCNQKALNQVITETTKQLSEMKAEYEKINDAINGFIHQAKPIEDDINTQKT